MHKVLVPTIATLTCLFSQNALAQSPHPIVGIWDLNPQESISETTPPDQRDIYRFVEAEDGFLLFTRVTIDLDGEPRWVQVAFRLDGEAYPLYTRATLELAMTTGEESHFMRVFSARDTHTIEDQPANGEGNIGIFRVSEDGQTLTVTRSGTNAQGQSFRNVLVYDRVE